MLGRKDSHRWTRRIRTVSVAMLVFVAAACGQSAAEAATTYTVGVDGSTEEFNASFERFFPNRLTVQPGDTIRFERPENGQPHTVSFGTAIPQTESCPGCNFFGSGFGSKPRLDASMPCFLAEGRPSFTDGCGPEQQESVPFSGTESWFNSGGLLGSEEYVLELADDIAPGTYVFVCLLHTSNMKGTITVVEPDDAADDPADVIARGVEQLEADIGRMRSALEQQSTVDESLVLAALEFNRARMWANTFTPEEIEVPVGGTVNWDIRGEHTIAFNAPESARPFYERADDGSVRQNEQAAELAGDASAWDGAGFLNSGLRAGLFPPARFSVTFTTPGTYTYICLIHFDMEGKVKVGG